MTDEQSQANVMEHILQSLKTIEITMKQHKEETREIKTALKKIAEANNKIEQKFQYLNVKNSELESRVGSTEHKINLLEKERRKKNLLIYGLKEESYENYEKRKNLILNFLEKEMKVEVQPSEVENVRRLGGKNTRTRPLIFTLRSMEKKIEILRHRKELRNSSIRIEEDFPKEVLRIRKELYPKLKEFRQEQKHAILKYDKLVVDGKVWNEENKKKRKPSESPNITMEESPRVHTLRRYSKKTRENKQDEETNYQFETDSDEFVDQNSKNKLSSKQKSDRDETREKERSSSEKNIATTGTQRI